MPFRSPRSKSAWRWLPLLCCLLAPTTVGAQGEARSRLETVRVAGIVLKWVRGDKEANYRRAEPLVREAARKGAQVVVTTECFLDGYAIADKSIPLETYRALGEPIPDGKYYQRLADLTREVKVHLVAGLLEADGDARYNTAVLIGPDGKLAGKYRKQKLGHESPRNTPGNASPVFETPFGRVGLMICADRTDREIVGRICAREADFLICPSGGMFGPKSNDPIVQARSRENEIPIVFVHPAEFLVTGSDGSILARSLLGDRLLIPKDEVGSAREENQVVFFTLPVKRNVAVRADEKPPLLKVGIIGLDTSHVVAFTDLLNKDTNKGPIENIRVVAAFPAGSPDLPVSADRIAGFTKTLREKHKVEIVGSIEELLKKVDAVLLESVDGRPHLEQVRPVLAAKKPVFIDKPVAASLADTIEIFELAKKHGVPCFSSSSLRFGERLQGLAKDPKVGRIKQCDTTGSINPLKGHPELFFYGIHGIEMLFTVLGPGCESVTWKDGVVTGTWKDGRVGTFRDAKGYKATVTGDKGTAESGGGDYQGLVRAIGTFFRTGKVPVPADETIDLVAFMVAAEESKKAGGKPVPIASVMKGAREEIAARRKGAARP